MKTTKPCSTVSYNSLPFLVGVLKRLTDNEMISFWAFIEHKPEEDENKAHCHVYIEPAKAIDTLWLRKQFQEPDPEHPDNPKGCMPIHASKFVDWYWYSLHDRAYLASKNQTRKVHYEPEDMLCSEYEVLAEYVRQNPNPKAELLKVYELLLEGYTPLQIAVNMNVPIRNLGYFMEGLNVLMSHRPELTDRNGKPNHEPDQIGQEKDDEID